MTPRSVVALRKNNIIKGITVVAATGSYLVVWKRGCCGHWGTGDVLVDQGLLVQGFRAASGEGDAIAGGRGGHQ